MKNMECADRILEMKEIIENRNIRPVFQPIVSLENGEVFGYEALSRIDKEKSDIGIEELFDYARDNNCLWKLEETCRLKALEKTNNLPENVKLFINVDPNVINDEKFINGFTGNEIKKYNLEPKDIIFEITEHSAIDEMELFQKTVRHYKDQDYLIAIDDVGSGYAGINRVCNLEPEFIKIDMNIVRNIHKDSIKKSVVMGVVQFCNAINTKIIAEGIEQKAELETLIELGISYGQGFYLGRPESEFKNVEDVLRKQIIHIFREQHKYKYVPSVLGEVGNICNRRETTSPDVQGSVIFEYMKKNPSVTEICVVDEEDRVVGLITRKNIMEVFGGQYGYALHAKHYAKDLVTKNSLMVEASVSIELTSKLAMARPQDMLYDAVVVTSRDKYIGVVTLKNLLETAINIQISRAVEANPLTGLPGNKAIEDNIESNIKRGSRFAAVYIDIDNFKAYNDAYGFNNGDIMIKALADNLSLLCGNTNDFVGHIGGDDFVVLKDVWDVEKFCKDLISEFEVSIHKLYSYEDRKRGWIVSKDRNGFRAEFPLATLSVSVLLASEKSITSVDAFSRRIAEIKKKCKQHMGNYYVIETA